MAAATFAYDGDQQRIRKQTPQETTVYFEEMYERATAAGGAVVHRYYVAAGTATLVVTREAGQGKGSAAYLHTDALGSTDLVTTDAGSILQRRSYDAFGSRRHPVWGQAPAGPFASKVSRVGFTGHEDEDDLGLVNMRGRIYDPKLGRFLQTDPIVSTPASGQSWNPYSYVHNSPLNFTDPSGFVDVPALDGYDTDPDVQRIIATGCHGKECLQKPGPSTPTTKASDAERDDMPAGAPPANVASPLGPGSTDPLPTVAAAADPNEWRQSAPARGAREFARGVLGGLAPLGVNVDELASKTGILPRGTRSEQLARHLGQMAGGFLEMSLGMFTVIHGAGLGAVSGGGSGPVSAAEIALGATVAAAGAWNLVQGWQALMSTGGGGSSAGGGGSAAGGGGRPAAGGGRAAAGGGRTGARPPNLSPPGAGRKGALAAAKRRNGVPSSQAPTRITPNVDKRGVVQPGRVYEFDVAAEGGGVRTVRIREDSAGHDYGPGDPQNRGPHFNDQDDGHYDY
jgi:RHS repeat-associated protein